MVLTDWTTSVHDSWLNIWDKFINFLPSLIGATIVLVVGWMIGMLVALLIDRLFRVIGLQTLFEKAKIEDVLKKANVDKDATEMLSAVAKWIVYLVALISAANILKLPNVANFLDSILAFVPQVVAAGLILLIGLVLANFLSVVMKASLSATDLGSAETVALITRYAIIIFAFLAALVQLGIASTMIQTLFLGVVAFLAIAGGLSFGLGGQGVAKDFLEHIRKNLK